MSYLAKKEFKSPIHISKPYWDENSLLLNLMCPTAGMLGGDKVELEVSVGPGASLTLSNPSSLRIHKMDAGSEANWNQSFRVSRDAFLENNPEWLILQGESTFTQRSSIDVEEGGELFFIEAIAPGRIAHQESFAFRQFSNRLAFRYQNKLALLEKHCISPELGTSAAWDNELGGKHPFYISILLASPKLDSSSSLWSEIRELQQDKVRIGSSSLAQKSTWCVKILAADPIAARSVLKSVRDSFYREIGRSPASLRR